MHASFPQLYGTIKLHKENLSMKPVVDFYSDPSISKTGFEPTYRIKNSIELTTKLASINFPTNSILISFDVKSIFTTIPVNRTKELMADILTEKGVPPDIVGDFRDLLSLCLKYNICTLKDKKYEW